MYQLLPVSRLPAPPMDLDFSAEERAFRNELRGWLRDHLPAALRDKVVRYAHLTRDDLLDWHRILAGRRWVAPAWPREWGETGWSVVQRYIVEEECGDADHHLERFAALSDHREGAA
ncbi:MAG: acyl-CoA dehydrogenase family protein [Casimicrobiaceae bacterium]